MSEYKYDINQMVTISAEVMDCLTRGDGRKEYALRFPDEVGVRHWISEKAITGPADAPACERRDDSETQADITWAHNRLNSTEAWVASQAKQLMTLTDRVAKLEAPTACEKPCEMVGSAMICGGLARLVERVQALEGGAPKGSRIYQWYVQMEHDRDKLRCERDALKDEVRGLHEYSGRLEEKNAKLAAVVKAALPIRRRLKSYATNNFLSPDIRELCAAVDALDS